MEVTIIENKVKVSSLAKVNEDKGFREEDGGKQKSVCDCSPVKGTWHQSYPILLLE